MRFADASDLALLEAPRGSLVLSGSLVSVFASTGELSSKGADGFFRVNGSCSQKFLTNRLARQFAFFGDCSRSHSADSESDHRNEDHNTDEACDEDDTACAGSQDDLALPRLLSRKDRAFITISIAASIAPITAHDRLLPWSLSRTTTALRLKFRMTALQKKRSQRCEEGTLFPANSLVRLRPQPAGSQPCLIPQVPAA
ncbi:hypothetical protein NKH19_11285 [Mesorhizobium sp. M1338]|uniref:hypothetical protein n=1 Tax=unclassified Mesorhizobium TaxID=325217 RepID=UPI00333A746B